VTADDDYQELGGDSLLATMLAARMKKAFKIRISPSLIMEHGTVREQARRVEAMVAEANGLRSVGQEKPETAPSPEKAAPPPDPPRAAPPPVNQEAAPSAPPQPARAKRQTDVPYREPQSETEEAIVTAWQDALSIEIAGRDDPFLELGGHTALAAKVAINLSTTLGVSLEAAHILDASTPAGLAEYVETLRWASLGADESQNLEAAEE
jgi:acyl carrier protein